MTALHASSRTTPVPRSRSVVRRDARRYLATNRALVALVATTCVIGVLVSLAPTHFPVNMLMVPVVVSTLFLRPRQLSRYIVFAMAVLAVTLLFQPVYSARLWASVGVYSFVGLFVFATSMRRSRLGLGGVEGESMLVDLRDRIQAQGRLPELPAGWEADALVRPADGTPFSGDFFCVAESACAGRLDVVLVDVSGKGVKAGTRSLQLSGALSGLLGAVGPDQLLGAANDFLLRQNWSEGFATAVYLSVDLDTGTFDVYTAGHPPALVLRAGEALERIDLSGPLLGVMPDAAYPAVAGRLEPGDALVVYTDGLVEASGVDIDDGIDLLGEVLLRESAPAHDGAVRPLATRTATGGPAVGVVERVVDEVGTPSDDCALLVLRRT